MVAVSANKTMTGAPCVFCRTENGRRHRRQEDYKDVWESCIIFGKNRNEAERVGNNLLSSRSIPTLESR
ncbi:hypothetical protein O3P69_014684 [Scylla paramamosain]|uniref:Uncharacterized protein n=1 Tax=Scylla paramamosain TaxID=85552 RepID=A0AAW0U127_SCYPA